MLPKGRVGGRGAGRGGRHPCSRLAPSLYYRFPKAETRVLTESHPHCLQVFPKHIADALAKGRKIEPEHHDAVTIFFSDIVGFTDISRKLDAVDVMNMLDRLYLKFDHLAEELGMFKVGGVPTAPWHGLLGGSPPE